jgi:hypothetical protein
LALDVIKQQQVVKKEKDEVEKLNSKMDLMMHVLDDTKEIKTDIDRVIVKLDKRLDVLDRMFF